ncbi:phosphoserine transaminase [Aquipuribacter sp. MA13-6]|uniref:phosphoserine transaminase n=1 Tax=unclassified Aquipuribacter TaxID=2635084 RepID=UPI003EE88FB3
MAAVRIPADLLPTDGRFGSGPSRIRAAQLDALAAAGSGLLGTSHRQEPVRALVRRVRHGVAELLGVPDGYEVVLGNGGSSAFWDVATGWLVGSRVQHLVHGEFAAKFAACTARAPFVAESDDVLAEPGSMGTPYAVAGVDTYAWPHNETSTGVLAPVQRVAGADPEALLLVDATSAAGGVAVDVSQTDAYYFAPQKAFGSDGGLWLAVLSPAAVARTEALRSSDRWVPDFLSLPAAIAASRKDETVNTPALTTLLLMAEQLDWLLGQGGLAWSAARCLESSGLVYDWAEQRDFATPFVSDPALRSPVVVTVDLVGVDAAEVARVLRANGVVDVDPYRKLGRNQLRVGTFPSVEPDDVRALLACVDHVVERLTA